MLKKMPFYKIGKEAQMEELKENKVDYIPMVERAFNIIELLYDSGEGMGVSEIAAQLQLPKATVYRILATMEKWGYIFQDFQTEKYNLGFNFIKVGESVKSTVDARTIALPFMEKLAEESGETVYLCKQYNDEALILETVSGEASALYSMVTPSIPLYCSALGRCLMVDFSKEQISKYVREKGMPKRTISTIGTEQELNSELNAIRKNEIGIEVEEYEYGMMCIAGMIKNSQGKTIASMSISGPTSRIRHKGEKKLTDLVKESCKAVSEKIPF